MIHMADLNQITASSPSGGRTTAQREDFLQMAAWERAAEALFEKLPESEEEEKGGFWTQRAQSQEEFMELQQKAAARQRLLMKLRMNGGHLSPAEVLMGLL